MSIEILLKNKRGILLAYDQGLEYGPTDFNERNVDPSFIMDSLPPAGSAASYSRRG